MISCIASAGLQMTKGIANSSAQNADTLGKWWCQKWGASRGNSAIDSRMHTNGRADHRGSRPTGLAWTAPAAAWPSA